MGKRVEGRSEKLLQCAMEEFMEMGFQDASLRMIAARADTTTGSIYSRFQDKEGLFHALTDHTVEELLGWFRQEQQFFDNLPADRKNDEVLTYAGEKWLELLDYLYAHWDVFRLLVRCTDIDCFDRMLDQLVDTDVDYTRRFVQTTGRKDVVEGRLSPMLLHMLSSAYYSGLFEVVRHDMKKEEAIPYVRQLRRFFVQGWADLLQIRL